MLVNRFITSKLSARGAKVVQYIAREAGVQRARRALAAIAQLQEASDRSAGPRRAGVAQVAEVEAAEEAEVEAEVEAVVEAAEAAEAEVEAAEVEAEVAEVAEAAEAAEQPPLSAAVLHDLKRLGLVRTLAARDGRRGRGGGAGVESLSTEEMNAALERRWRGLLGDSVEM